MSSTKNTQSNEKPSLVISQNGGKQIAYICSLCGRRFSLSEERIPKDAVAKLWGEFKLHVQDEHAERDGPGGGAQRE
jgi:hypothetical protein